MDDHIHQSNLIEDKDDPFADLQSMMAWYYLEVQDELNVSVILDVHRLITASQADLADDQRGQWRRVWVTVGGRRCPAPEMVPHLMANWVLYFESRPPLENHVAFERIHPFYDGNGRTGRMFMWWQELRLGMKPTLIRADQRQEYYRLFR